MGIPLFGLGLSLWLIRGEEAGTFGLYHLFQHLNEYLYLMLIVCSF